MTTLKLIFMGTPGFALPTLQALVESRHQVVAVYTQPPRPAKRGLKEIPSPVHEYALSKGLTVLTPTSLKDPQVQSEFKQWGADAAIVAAYGLLLPQPILDATRMGCINVHPSLLPRWRGAAPIQRTIMAGDKETAMVIMQMNAGLDTGDMLTVKHVDIADGTTSGELHDALAVMAGPMVVETLAGLSKGTILRTSQPEAGVTYAHKITRDDAIIDWAQPAQVVHQLILGLSPHPGANFRYHDEVIKILKADVIPLAANSAPGTVTDDILTIQCGKDALRPTLIQRPGKKAMATTEMLRGYAIPKGTVLGQYDSL